MARELLIAHSGEDNIWRIPIDGLRKPELIAVNSCQQHDLTATEDGWACACAFEGSIAVGDRRIRSLTPVGAGACAIAAMGSSVYVTCCDSDSVWKLDAGSGIQRCVARSGCYPIDICCCTKNLFVANLLSLDVCAYDAHLRLKKRIPLEGMPLCIDQFGDMVVAFTLTAKECGICHAISRSGAVKWTWRSGNNVTAFAQANETSIIAANAWDDSLYMMDLVARKTLWSISTKKMPESVKVDAEENKIYVACQQSSCVQVFDFFGKLLKEIAVGKEPCSIALIQ